MKILCKVREKSHFLSPVKYPNIVVVSLVENYIIVCPFRCIGPTGLPRDHGKQTIAGRGMRFLK